jgi:predicted secreted Zn-dependent protease
MTLQLSKSRLSSPRTIYTLLLLLPLSAFAQLSTVWTTNYYTVTGANFREIRQSLASSRPWKDGFDGDTRWTVSWNFNLTSTPATCSCSSFSTTLKITTTLPRWTPPTNAVPEVKEQWARYFTALAQHEAGHARVGSAGAAEVHKAIAQVPAQADCETLRKLINERAERILDDYRAREKEYDRRTDHGMRPAERP